MVYGLIFGLIMIGVCAAYITDVVLFTVFSLIWPGFAFNFGGAIVATAIIFALIIWGLYCTTKRGFPPNVDIYIVKGICAIGFPVVILSIYRNWATLINGTNADFPWIVLSFVGFPVLYLMADIYAPEPPVKIKSNDPEPVCEGAKP